MLQCLSLESTSSILPSNAKPPENFDLLGWNLSAPVDVDNNDRSNTTSAEELNDGYETKVEGDDLAVTITRDEKNSDEYANISNS